MKQRIVHLERDSVIAKVRRPNFAHDWVEYPSTRPDQVIERLQACTIAIVNKAPLPSVAVDALPELKMVAVAATGTNVIDLDACRRRGIVVVVPVVVIRRGAMQNIRSLNMSLRCCWPCRAI